VTVSIVWNSWEPAYLAGDRWIVRMRRTNDAGRLSVFARFLTHSRISGYGPGLNRVGDWTQMRFLPLVRDRLRRLSTYLTPDAP